MRDQPSSVRRAAFPAAYGPRGGKGDELMAWPDVERRLEEAPNYWLVTVTPDGSPHARPVDGVWVAGVLCFGGAPETRWLRNLLTNPVASAHLPGGDDVVIVEGVAEHIDDPAHPLAAASSVASLAKYPQYASPGEPPAPEPFWALRPAVVYAWALATFPRGATRFSFEG